MKLKEISILNFKSFGNLNVKYPSRMLDLTQLNLIFGHNSSGKSNILKFLELLFSSKTVRESLTIEGTPLVRKEGGSFWRGTIFDQPFIFHKNKRDAEIKFDVSIEINKDELEQSGFEYNKIFIDTYFGKGKVAIIQLVGSIKSLGDFYSSEIKLDFVELNKKRIYTDKPKAKEYFQGIGGLEGDSSLFESLLGVFNNLIFFLDKDRYLVTEEEDSKSRLLSPHNFKNWIYNLSLDAINYKKFEDFIDFVKKYGSSIDILKNFSPTFSKTENGQIDILLSNGSERLPIGSYGTGIQQLILLLAMLFNTSSKIILIEELELNLSPISQQRLLHVFTRLIDDKKIDQVIFTSHSKILAETPNLSVYEVEISKDGISSVKDIAGKKSDFFKIDPQIKKQMSNPLRQSGKKGAEWF